MRTPAGRSAARAVALIAPLAEDLHAWRDAAAEREPGPLVFPGRISPNWADGEWAAWCSDVFVPAARACGLDIERPHELRHTFCTLLLHEGLPAAEVARMVGEGPRLIKKVYGYLIGTMGSRERIHASDLVQEIRESLADQRAPMPVTHSGIGRE